MKLAIILPILQVFFFFKATSAAEGLGQDDPVVQEILRVAAAVKAVERAGGPQKILQDPRFRAMPPRIKRVLRGLEHVLQVEPSQQSEIQPRMVGGLMLLGLKSLVNVFTFMMRPKTAKVDVEMDF